MASVLNRTTNQYLVAVNTPDYPTSAWIINPDLSAVAGFASQYWIITGNVVTLMSPAQRAAVDAAAATATLTELQRIATNAFFRAGTSTSPVFPSATLDQRVRALEFIIYGS